MLDQAFEVLKTYDWGPDLKALEPISQAAVTAEGDERAKLEKRLLALLEAGVPRGAVDFICRRLMMIGTAASVPALAAMLSDEENAHMARYALERIEAPEAGQALAEALPKLSGKLKIGVITSLAKRKDVDCVDAIAKLLGDDDAAVALAAAQAMGVIRSEAAAKALQQAGKVNDAAVAAATDSKLACAESLLAAGNKAGALALYKSLATGDQPKHVKVAATRGMLACAGKKD